MNVDRNPYVAFGAYVAAGCQNVTPSELRVLAATNESLSSQAYGRELCKVASAIYEDLGAGQSVVGVLMRNLSEAETWHPELDKFADCVASALSKSATVLPAAAMAASGVAGPLLRTLLAAGAITGTAAGSLGFLLSRDARQTSDENAELLEKVRAYNQIRRDIEEDIADKDLLTTDKKGPARYDV